MTNSLESAIEHVRAVKDARKVAENVLVFPMTTKSFSEMPLCPILSLRQTQIYKQTYKPHHVWPPQYVTSLIRPYHCFPYKNQRQRSSYVSS